MSSYSKLLQYIIAGFAVFAMFFGAGNLIYPINIGMETSGHHYWSTLGILITGVFLPLVGLVSIILYKGDIEKFFNPLGGAISFALVVLMLALLGPVAAVPRCIIISFSGFKALFNDLNLVWFDLLFCTVLLFSVLYKNKVIDIIGKWLTPILITGGAIIIYCAVLDNTAIEATTNNISELQSFSIGILQGYQTMDLCAAIFFGIIIFEYVKNKVSDESVCSVSLVASIIGAILLLLVYIAFVFIGAKYSNILGDVSKEQMLIIIAKQAMNNKFALPIVSMTIFTACLTTAIALVDLVVNWISDRFDILAQKRIYIVIPVIMIAFIFVLLGFDALTMLLANILMVLYPALISVAITNIIDYVFNTRLIKPTFWVVCCMSFAYNLLLYR